MVVKLNKQVIDRIRAMFPSLDEELITEIVFDEPEDVLLWLEELTRYDIVRLKKGILDEESIDHDLTKLNAEITKRLEKIIKLKRTKAEKGEIKWEDLS
jgi:hypothetical protein